MSTTSTDVNPFREKARALLPAVEVAYQGAEEGVHTFQVAKGSTRYRPTYNASEKSWRCTCREFRTQVGTCVHVELVKLWRAQQQASNGEASADDVIGEPADPGDVQRNGQAASPAPPPPPAAQANGAPPPPRPASVLPVEEPVSQPAEANVNGSEPAAAFPTPATTAGVWSEEIARRLLEPFPASLVGWKAQATTKDGSRAMAVAYIDARAVMDRLDEVVGPNGWSDSYTVLNGPGAPFGNEVVVACQLTVLGVTKCDVGVGEDAKSAFSDAFKRAAVKVGISRYLYSLGKPWVAYDAQRKQLKEIPKLPA